MLIKQCKTKGAFEAIPDKSKILSLDKLKSKYQTLADLPVLVIIKINGHEVTCYKNGKLVIRGCATEDQASVLADEIYGVAK